MTCEPFIPAERFTHQTEIHDYLNQHGILVAYSPIVSPEFDISFIDEKAFWKGETVFVPINLRYTPRKGRVGNLNSAIGLKVVEKISYVPRQHVGYVENWATDHGLSVEGEEGKFWVIDEHAFSTLVVSPEQVSQHFEPQHFFYEKQAVRKSEKIEKGPERDKEIPVKDLKITAQEINEIKACDGNPYGALLPNAYKAKLAEMTRSGIPNNPTSMRYWLDTLPNILHSGFVDTAEWEPTESTVDPRFSLTLQKQFVEDLWRGMFRDFDMTVKYPKVTFSEYSAMYRLFLETYMQVVHGEQVPRHALDTKDNRYTEVGNVLHNMDSIFDGLRSYSPSEEIYPTSKDRAVLHDQIVADNDFPIFPHDVEEIAGFYTDIAGRYLSHWQTLGIEDDCDDYWRKEENTAELKRKATLFAMHWAERAWTEQSEHPKSQREVTFRCLVPSRPDAVQPLGLAIEIRLDAITKYITRGLEMEDLKVSWARFKDRKSDQSAIEAEVQLRETQLLDMLFADFVASYWNADKYRLAPPNKGIYFHFLNEAKLVNVDSSAFRRWYQPDTGMEEKEPVGEIRQRLESAYLARNIIGPLAHLKHSFGGDQEALREHILDWYSTRSFS